MAAHTLLQGPPNTRLIVRLELIDIEIQQHCLYDYLEIEDEYGQVKEVYPEDHSDDDPNEESDVEEVNLFKFNNSDSLGSGSNGRNGVFHSSKAINKQNGEKPQKIVDLETNLKTSWMTSELDDDVESNYSSTNTGNFDYIDAGFFMSSDESLESANDDKKLLKSITGKGKDTSGTEHIQKSGDYFPFHSLSTQPPFYTHSLKASKVPGNTASSDAVISTTNENNIEEKTPPSHNASKKSSTVAQRVKRIPKRFCGRISPTNDK